MSENRGERSFSRELEAGPNWQLLESPDYYLEVADRLLREGIEKDSQSYLPIIGANLAYAGKTEEALKVIDCLDEPDQLADIYIAAIDGGNQEITTKLTGLEEAEFKSDRGKVSFLSQLIARGYNPDTNAQHAEVVLERLDRSPNDWEGYGAKEAREKLVAALETAGDFPTAYRILSASKDATIAEAAKLNEVAAAYELAAISADKLSLFQKNRQRRVRHDLIKGIEFNLKHANFNSRRGWSGHGHPENALVRTHALRTLALAGDQKALSAVATYLQSTEASREAILQTATPREIEYYGPGLTRDVEGGLFSDTYNRVPLLIKYGQPQDIVNYVIKPYKEDYLHTYNYSSQRRSSWGVLARAMGLDSEEDRQKYSSYQAMPINVVLEAFKERRAWKAHRLGVAYHTLALRLPRPAESDSLSVDAQRAAEASALIASIGAALAEQSDSIRLSGPAYAWQSTELQNAATKSVEELLNKVNTVTEPLRVYELCRQLNEQFTDVTLDESSTKKLHENILRAGTHLVLYADSPSITKKQIMSDLKRFGIKNGDFDQYIKNHIENDMLKDHLY